MKDLDHKENLYSDNLEKYSENNISKPNRYKKKKPKLGMFWCGCDLDFIYEGKKCRICLKKITKNRKPRLKRL